ncbi:MAG: nucleotidyltransferase family protein [Pyrinomonadaceae bacterium]
MRAGSLRKSLDATHTSRAAISPGAIIAELLAGAWRRSPPLLNISRADVEAVTPLLLKSRAAPLSWWRILHSDLRASLENGELHQAYRFNALETQLRRDDLKHVFALLRASGIEPILIKGWGSARLYPEPGLRPYEDIDLCVAPEQFALAESALKNIEGRQYLVDLVHYEVTRFDRRSWDELYSRSRLVRFDDSDIRIPSAEDHLRLLCIHLLGHGASRPLWLCDIALEIESRPNDFDWDLCVGSKQPQADWVICAIRLAHRLLRVKVDVTPLANRAAHLPDWVLKRVLERWALPDGCDTQRLATRLRHGDKIFKALRSRWPDPIMMAVNDISPLDEKPKLRDYLACYFAPRRIERFIKDLPRLWWREQD